MAKPLAVCEALVIPKDSSIYVANYLHHSEFKCGCERPECHYTLVAPSLKNSWVKLRIEWQKPLTINSGYRCQAHNIDVDGSPTSSHTYGHALDISYRGMDHVEKKAFIAAARAYFDVVLDYELQKFIHAHNICK